MEAIRYAESPTIKRKPFDLERIQYPAQVLADRPKIKAKVSEPLYQKRILDIRSIGSDLATFLDEPPSDYAIVVSKSIAFLLEMSGINDAKLSPSPEGGVMFEFYRDDGTYYLIEIYNDGDFVFLKRNLSGESEAFDYDFKSLIQEILRRFV